MVPYRFMSSSMDRVSTKGGKFRYIWSPKVRVLVQTLQSANRVTWVHKLGCCHHFPRILAIYNK